MVLGHCELVRVVVHMWCIELDHNQFVLTILCCIEGTTHNNML